jgi:hypothetical protein
MQHESDDPCGNIPKGDKPELETKLDVNQNTVFVFSLDSQTRHKLHHIMENRSHFVHGTTLKELIDEEHERIGLKDATI